MRFFVKTAISSFLISILLCASSNEVYAQAANLDSDGDGVFDHLDPEPNRANVFPRFRVEDAITREDHYSHESDDNFNYGRGASALNHSFDWKPTLPENTPIQIESIQMSGTIDDWVHINGQHLYGDISVEHIQRNINVPIVQHLNRDNISGDDEFNIKIFDHVDVDFPDTNPDKNESYINVNMSTVYYKIVPQANLTAFSHASADATPDSTEATVGSLITVPQIEDDGDASSIVVDRIFPSERYRRVLVVTTPFALKLSGEFFDADRVIPGGRVIIPIPAAQNINEINLDIIGTDEEIEATDRAIVHLFIEDLEVVEGGDRYISQDVVYFRPIGATVVPVYIRPTEGDPDHPRVVYSPIVSPPFDDGEVDGIYYSVRAELQNPGNMENLSLVSIRARLIDEASVERTASQTWTPRFVASRRAAATGDQFTEMSLTNGAGDLRLVDLQNYSLVFDVAVSLQPNGANPFWLNGAHIQDVTVNQEIVAIARWIAHEDNTSDLSRTRVIQTVLNRFNIPNVTGSLMFDRASLRVAGVDTLLGVLEDGGAFQLREGDVLTIGDTIQHARELAQTALENQDRYDPAGPLYFHKNGCTVNDICKNMIDGVRRGLMVVIPTADAGNTYYGPSPATQAFLTRIGSLPVGNAQRVALEQQFVEYVRDAYRADPNDSLPF